MDQTTLSLVSGLLGSLIGAYVAMAINRNNRRVAAVENMLAVVYPIGFKLWWQPEDGKPAIPFHDNYSELWSAYSALRSAVPFWKRRSLDNAWQEFMVMEFYRKIPNDQFEKVFVKGTVMSRKQAVNNCGKFIVFTNNLR